MKKQEKTNETLTQSDINLNVCLLSILNKHFYVKIRNDGYITTIGIKDYFLSKEEMEVLRKVDTIKL